MIGKKRISIFAAAALAVAMVASPMVSAPAHAANKCAAAKNKTKGCKNEIKGCTGYGCTGLKGKAKKQCAKACKKAVTDTCKASTTGTVCTASPSGAFLE